LNRIRQESNAEYARQANIAATLLLTDAVTSTWEILAAPADDDLRNFLIHRIAVCGVAPEILIKRMESDERPLVKSALMFVLGSLPASEFSANSMSNLIRIARNEFDANPHPGVHSACEWLAMRLGFRDRMAVSQKFANGRIWEVMNNGHTMVWINHTAPFNVGSLPEEPGHDTNERVRTVSLSRPFAISTTEVTVKQYRAFQASSDIKSGSDTEPVRSVNLQDAMKYCRWLSHEAGLSEKDMCYRVTESGSISPYPDFHSRSGYRLPLEIEWEFACRAGSKKSRYFGRASALIDEYAWHGENSQRSCHPVGLLKPNHLGLFDMYGNVEEWCQNVYVDQVEIEAINPRSVARPMRGGSCLSPVSVLRSARRRQNVATYRMSSLGFRICRSGHTHRQ